MKVNITFNDELFERMEEYASENYMTRSGLVSLAVTQYLNQSESIRLIKGIALAIDKLAANGVLSDDIIRQLESYESLSKILVKL